MLYSLPKCEQSVGENVSEEKKVQNRDARGVEKAELSAETTPYSAAEAPGGYPSLAGPRATFASPGSVGPGGPCPCGDDHSGDYEDDGSNYVDDGSVYSPGTAAGSGFVGVPEDPDVSGHELLCGCPDCRASDDSCSGCGEFCNEDFCECLSDCTSCLDVDLGLEQFTFTCAPDVIPPGDFQDCWNPDTFMAFWDDDKIIVADTQSDARWEVISYEQQGRASSRPYYTWYCARIGVLDPCDESFMRSISS